MKFSLVKHWPLLLVAAALLLPACGLSGVDSPSTVTVQQPAQPVSQAAAQAAAPVARYQVSVKEGVNLVLVPETWQVLLNEIQPRDAEFKADVTSIQVTVQRLPYGGVELEDDSTNPGLLVVKIDDRMAGSWFANFQVMRKLYDRMDIPKRLPLQDPQSQAAIFINAHGPLFQMSEPPAFEMGNRRYRMKVVEGAELNRAEPIIYRSKDDSFQHVGWVDGGTIIEGMAVPGWVPHPQEDGPFGDEFFLYYYYIGQYADGRPFTSFSFIPMSALEPAP